MRTAAKQAQFVAIVLGRRAWRESDRIVHLLTAEHGIVTALARAARASRRRFQGALELFTTVHVRVSHTRSLLQIDSADILVSHVGLRARLDTIELASVLADCIRALTPEGEAAPEAFAAFGDALDELDRSDLAASARAWPRLLKTWGIAPDLDRCGRCGAAEPNHYGFDVHLMLLCAACGAAAQPLSGSALAVLRGASCTNEQVAREVTALCVRWIEAHIGRSLVSVAHMARPGGAGRQACSL